MNTRSKIVAKIVAAGLGVLVAGGAVADASAATVTTTKTVTAKHAMRPVVAHRGLAKKIVITHRFHRPMRHLAGIRVVPGHRLAPRIHVARAVTKKVVKTTVVR